MPQRPAAKGGAIPFVGPYAQNQALAEYAYQQAQANLANQRGQTLLQYGYRPTSGGGMEADPNNPYGQLQQTLRTNQTEADQLGENMRGRGFTGPGFASQAERAAQESAGGRSYALAQSLLGAQGSIASQGLQEQMKYAQSTLHNKQGSVEYAIKNNLFTPHAQQRTNAQSRALVDRMRSAWVQQYGGVNQKSKISHLNFQQRINQLGNRLYSKQPNFLIGTRRVK